VLNITLHNSAAAVLPAAAQPWVLLLLLQHVLFIPCVEDHTQEEHYTKECLTCAASCCSAMGPADALSRSSRLPPEQNSIRMWNLSWLAYALHMCVMFGTLEVKSLQEMRQKEMRQKEKVGRTAGEGKANGGRLLLLLLLLPLLVCVC
jgi:hypothetical protein